MKGTYQAPLSKQINLHLDTMLASSPELHPELGGDQLSNQQTTWDEPEWNTDED